MDELSLNDDDIGKMKAGEISELEETLTWFRENTTMTLAAMSSTSLLDRHNSNSDSDDPSLIKPNTSQEALDEMIATTGFAAVRLEHIMRSSQNIAAATSPTSVSEALSSAFKFNIPETILPGVSSTVPGTRPKAWIYKYNDEVDTANNNFYKRVAGFVTKYLRSVDTERLKCVVLTDKRTSARRLSDQLRMGNMLVSCFDGGVEIFDHNYGTPKYRDDSAGDSEEAELTSWLRAEGGVLVTSEVQFRGAEADSVIFVTRCWSGYSVSSSSRSAVTRAVAGLLVITSDNGINVPKLRKNWEVEILEEGAGD